MSKRALPLIMAAALLACVTAGGPAAAAYLPIMFKTHTFDPLSGVPWVSAALKAMPPPSGVPAYYVLQCTGPVQQAWPGALAQAGAQIADYIPTYAFAVRMTPEAAARVQAVPFVRWVGLYQPAYKVPASLLARQSATVVTIRLFPGEDPNLIASAVRLLGGYVLAISRGGAAGIRAVVNPAALPSIARLSAVSWVEQWVPPRLYNNFARRIMNVSFAPGAVVGGYDVWANLGLFGHGQAVAVADTGLSTANAPFQHPDFYGRVIAGFSYVPGEGWEDPHGHGTHVAGSVAGNGLESGSIPSSQEYTSSFAGVAPEASLVVQRIFDESGNVGQNVPDDLSVLFQQAYNAGARIHTNSWGADVRGQYTTDSEQVDNFTWQHKDMVVLFAGGNAGAGPGSYGQIGSPATAKNCLSVGASESDRGPPPYADNAGGIADFSSRGPTEDGRTKPDVVAPGTEILSTRSQLISIYESFTGQLSPNPAYMFASGTSMSTPLTAGVAALVREYYKRIQSPFIPARANPSAALIKATIMAGAVDLTPGQYQQNINTPYQEVRGRPDQAQGWGRVNLGDIAYDKYLGNGIFFREGSSRAILAAEYAVLRTDATGQWSAQWRVYVSDSSAPFRVLMAWTDYPSTPAAARNLVNDLDLQVAAPTLPDATGPVQTWIGSGSGPAKRAGIGQPDRINNVEGVEILAPVRGWYTIGVRGQNVPHPPQPFALVILAPMAKTFGISGKVTDSAGALIPGVQITVSTRWGPVKNTFTGLLGTQDFGKYKVDGLPAGTYIVKATQAQSGGTFTPAQREVTLPTGSGDAGNVDLQLSLVYQAAGWVLTPQRTPVADADVTATEQATGLTTTTRTNSQGFYQVSLTSGTYTIKPSRAGWTFDPPNARGTLSGSAITFWADFTGGAPYPLYTISGVVRTTTGVALGGVNLSFTGNVFGSVGSVQTDAGGIYAKTGLRNDTYTVQGSKPGYLVHPALDGVTMWGSNAVRIGVAPFNAAQNWVVEPRGVAISAVTVSAPLKVGSASKVSVVVRNLSHGQETNLSVNVLDNGAPVGSPKSVASLGGLASATVEFSWVPMLPGVHSIRVLVQPIPYEPVTTDNRKDIVVTVSP